MSQRDTEKLVWTGGGRMLRLLFCACERLVIDKKGKWGSKEDIVLVDKAGCSASRDCKSLF